ESPPTARDLDRSHTLPSVHAVAPNTEGDDGSPPHASTPVACFPDTPAGPPPSSPTLPVNTLRTVIQAPIPPLPYGPEPGPRLRPAPGRACAPRGPHPSPPAPDDRRTAPRRRKSPAVRSGPSGARTACTTRPRWPPPLPGSRSTATRPPSLPSAATPSRIVESRLLAAEFPASGSPASRPPASLRRPEPEPRRLSSSPSSASAAASPAACALSGRPSLAPDHASRWPRLSSPGAAAPPSPPPTT